MAIVDRASLNKIKRDMRGDFSNNFNYLNNIGKIGSFGEILFKVNEGDIITPTSISINIGSDVTKHKNLRTPEIAEFKNRKLRNVSLPIKLLSSLCNIPKTLETLTNICENGEFYDLIIARKKIGKEPFRLVSMNYSFSKTDGGGNPLIVDLNLQLEEYIENLNRNGSELINVGSKSNGLKEKTIRNINSKVLSDLKGGRLW